MAMIFRTAGAWGAGSGANLTPAQVDQNFYELFLSIEGILDSTDIQGVGIANIVVVGSQMTIILTDATELGPFTLPTASFIFRGEWAPSVVYAGNDVFTVSGAGLFLVLQPHTSDTVFDPAEADTSGAFYQLMISVVDLSGGVTVITDGAYTITAADGGKTFRFTDLCNVTFPVDATDFDIPLGVEIKFQQDHITDAVNFFIETGGALNHKVSVEPSTSEQFAVVIAQKVGDSEWTLRGDLLPASGF